MFPFRVTVRERTKERKSDRVREREKEREDEQETGNPRWTAISTIGGYMGDNDRR